MNKVENILAIIIDIIEVGVNILAIIIAFVVIGVYVWGLDQFLGSL